MKQKLEPTYRHGHDISSFHEFYSDLCTKCRRNFCEKEETYLGVDSNGNFQNVGNCCYDCLTELFREKTYYPSFYIKPPETNRLWRYMGFDKFVSMLKNKAVYFPAADQFDDPFEGAKGLVKFQEQWIKEQEEIFEEVSKSWYESMGLEYTPSKKKEDAQSAFNLHNYGRYLRRTTFISCWHENDSESEAMWKLYCPDLRQGVAISTTFKKLFWSLNKNQFVRVGRVNYINYENRTLDMCEAFWYKRKSFEHEREVRAEIFDFRNPNLRGLNIDVSLESLIDAVYVSPTAPSWFYEIVKDVMRKYELDKPVIWSKIKQQPFY